MISSARKCGFAFCFGILPFLLNSCFTSSVWGDFTIHEKFTWQEKTLKLEQKNDAVLVTRRGTSEKYVIPFDFFQFFATGREEDVLREDRILRLNQKGVANGISCAFFVRAYPAVTPVSTKTENGLSVYPAEKLQKIDTEMEQGDGGILVSVVSSADFQGLQSIFLYNNGNNAEIVVPELQSELEPNLFCIYATRYVLLPGYSWNNGTTATEYFPVKGGWMTGTRILFTPLALAMDTATLPFQIIYAISR